MGDVAEKLGITPIYIWNTVCSASEAKELEQQRNKLLKALMKSVTSIEKILYEVKPNLWSNVSHELDVAYSEGKEAILNTDPSHRQFEELKELLYEII